MKQPNDDGMKLTDRKHKAIVEAAVDVFLLAGFEGARMGDIAVRANVSKRTLYKHFSTKDQLFAEVIDAIMMQSAEHRFVSYAHDRPLRPQLKKLFALSLDRIVDPTYHDFAKLVIPEALASTGRAKELTSRMRQTNQPIYTWVEAALKDGRIHGGDASTLAYMFSGILHSFGLLPQLFLGTEGLSESEKKKIVTQSVDLFLSAYEVR